MKKIFFFTLLAILLPLISSAQADLHQDRVQAIAELNRIRAQMGLGYLHQDRGLKKAALDHARFGVENAGKPKVDAHHQAFIRNFFTGHGLADRIAHSGFKPVMHDAIRGGDFFCEVISPSSLNHQDALRILLDAPYHRGCLLDMHVVQIGFGCGVHKHDSSSNCVADLYGIGGASFSQLSGLEPADMTLGAESCVTGRSCPEHHSKKQKLFIPYLKANLMISQAVNRIDQQVIAGREPRSEDVSLIHDKLFWLAKNGVHINAPDVQQKLNCTENSSDRECQEFWDNPVSAMGINQYYTMLHYAHRVHEQVAADIEKNLRQWPDITYFPFETLNHQVPTAFARHFEKPSPLPVGLEVSGYPVSFYFSPLFHKVVLEEFVLMDSRGQKISTLQIDRDLDPNVQDNGGGGISSPTPYHSYIFLPVDELQGGKTYTAEVRYRTKKAKDHKWTGQQIKKWSFTAAKGQTAVEGELPENIGSCLTANSRAASCLVSTGRGRAGCVQKIVDYHRACEQVHDRRTARWMTAEEAAEDFKRKDQEEEGGSADDDF